MVREKYGVRLTTEGRNELEHLVRAGRGTARAATRARKMDDRAEAHLIALACSPAPEGHDHRNLRLLADRMVELGAVESLSHETVRLHPKKSPNPWTGRQEFPMHRSDPPIRNKVEDSYRC